MKAVVIDRYGSADVLQYREIEQPQIEPSELLVKVHASSIIGFPKFWEPIEKLSALNS